MGSSASRFSTPIVPTDRVLDMAFESFISSARKQFDVPIYATFKAADMESGYLHRLVVRVGDEPRPFEAEIDFSRANTRGAAEDLIECAAGQLYDYISSVAERYAASRAQRELAARIDGGEWWALFEGVATVG